MKDVNSQYFDEEQVKAADYVYLFTDPDREGSVIA